MALNMDLINMRLEQIRQLDNQAEESKTDLFGVFLHAALVAPQRDALVQKMIREIQEMSK